ncbi:phage protease [Rhodopseudomonas pseudopalustris]|uniref:Mu-like prophage I protein n=1 Tax=Rhodopseudomonas pseudopalustris TaxID=1513892 RepID=A0A1H8V9A5_9BRAD|nr:phage protease [Rhodopseudomonas pseudopalustris]SEP11863.1 Mu-like prophage I protein [Rhodopseudomonas pseudopalustris]
MSGQANPVLNVARGVGQPIALNADGSAPEWIMLIPAGDGGLIGTVDGRGPYRVASPATLAAQSVAVAGGRLVLDESHSTDLAAPKGEPAPARGWIVDVASRDGGIWGRVEWNPSGAALMADKAYRFISPVFTHDAAGNVLTLLRASLTNTPNLRGMAALHQVENTMDLLAQLRALLGLDDTADEAAVIAKIKDLKGGDATALNAALSPIATAIGLAANADAATIVTKVKTFATDRIDGSAIVALQSELRDVTTQLNALRADKSTDAATAFVDRAIRDGVVGVKPLRDHYIARHAADPAGVEKEINSFPRIGASGALQTAPAADGKVSLNAEQLNVAKILGIKPEDYARTLAAEQAG